MQAALLADCLAPTGDGAHGLGPQEALDAELALLPHLRALLGSVARVSTEAEVLRIVKSAPSNPLCQAVLHAHAAMGVRFGTIVTPAAPKPLGISGRSSLASCDRAWAQAVWAMSIAPGAYWDWVHMGGHRGMLAALAQFGEANALDRLQDKAASHRAATARDQREREHVTNALWRSFGLKGFVPRVPRVIVPPLPAATSETAALARSVAARARSVAPGARWSQKVVEAVLTAIEISEEGEARLSVRDIVRTANDRHGARWTNEARVHDALVRVCSVPDAVDFLFRPTAGKAAPPLVAAFVRVTQCSAESEKSLFLPGPAIYGNHVHAQFYQGYRS